MSRQSDANLRVSHFLFKTKINTFSYFFRNEHFYEDVRNEINCIFLFTRTTFLGLSDQIGLCNDTVHKEILYRMKENLDYKGIYQKCTSKMACKQPTYIMEMTNGMEVENPLIGGTLGLTLGLSFYSLLDLVEYLEQKFMK